MNLFLPKDGGESKGNEVVENLNEHDDAAFPLSEEPKQGNSRHDCWTASL